MNDLPTDEQAGAAAEGMYLTFAGLGPDQIKERGGAAAEFLTAYETEYGKPEVYTIYGAAAMQPMLKAIEASDGTRESVIESVVLASRSPPRSRSWVRATSSTRTATRP